MATYQQMEIMNDTQLLGILQNLQNDYQERHNALGYLVSRHKRGQRIIIWGRYFHDSPSSQILTDQTLETGYDKLWNHFFIKEDKNVRNFGAFSTTIYVNTALDILRSRNFKDITTQTQSLEGISENIEDENPINDVEIQDTKKEKLPIIADIRKELLKAFSKSRVDVFIDYLWEGLSKEEIAEKRKIDIKAVTVYICEIHSVLVFLSDNTPQRANGEKKQELLSKMPTLKALLSKLLPFLTVIMVCLPLTLYTQKLQVGGIKVYITIADKGMPYKDGAVINVWRDDLNTKNGVPYIPRTGRTNERGWVLIDSVPSGTYRLQCQMFPNQYKEVPDIQQVNVEAGTVTEHTIYLQGKRSLENTKDVQPIIKPLNPYIVAGAYLLSANKMYENIQILSDPNRNAATTACTQVPRDEYNSLIIRGCNPQMTVWRLEGMDIFGPHQFMAVDGSGGQSCAIEADMFAPSELLVGGLTAEYGNSHSGVLDMKLRHGNLERVQTNLKYTIYGTGVGLELPIIKNKLAYLGNFRWGGQPASKSPLLWDNRLTQTYSNMLVSIENFATPDSIKTQLNGIDKKTWDMYHHLFWQINPKTEIALFVLMAQSTRKYDMNESIIPYSQRKSDDDFLQLTDTTTQQLVGVTLSRIFRDKHTLKLNFAYNHQNIFRQEEDIGEKDTVLLKRKQRYDNRKEVLAISYNHYFDEKWVAKFGIQTQLLHFTGSDIAYIDSVNEPVYRTLRSANKENILQTQIYGQTKWHMTEHSTWVMGANMLYSNYLSEMNSNRKKPTFGIRFAHEYEIGPDQNFTLSGGIYNQVIPYWNNFYVDEKGAKPNRYFPYTQSIQIGAVYNVNKKNPSNYFLLRTRVEGYYHNYWNIPIANTGTYSPINDLYTYTNRSLTRKGWAENYGVEITIEPEWFSKIKFKPLKGLDVLFSLSTHRSSYTPETTSQIAYRGRFDNWFNSSLYLRKEWKLSRNKDFPRLEISGRLFLSKSFRYTPADTALSASYNMYIPNESLTYYKTMRGLTLFGKETNLYPRIDFHAAIRWGNLRKHGNSILISFDAQNFPFIGGDKGFLGIIKAPYINTYWDRKANIQGFSNNAYQFRLTNCLYFVSFIYFFNGKA